MSEPYAKNQVEQALTDHGFVIWREDDNNTIYQTNFSPGADILVDWSRGQLEWEDLQLQLEDQDIDPQPIHDHLLADSS